MPQSVENKKNIELGESGEDLFQPMMFSFTANCRTI